MKLRSGSAVPLTMRTPMMTTKGTLSDHPGVVMYDGRQGLHHADKQSPEQSEGERGELTDQGRRQRRHD